MLVNEVAAELLEGEMLPGRNHHQFFAYVSKAMRHVLVDHARSRGRLKRGGGFARLELTDALVVCEEQPAELLALNVALEKLAENDQRKARVVELRYFGGFSVDEAAEVLGISPATVKRDWEIARTWLFRELTRGDSCVD
jgi:RNA polymerase sigma factor (TIGR02999 family)